MCRCSVPLLVGFMGCFCLVLVLLLSRSASAEPLYKKRPDLETRWVSFENPTGAKGAAAKENQGAKGHAFDSLKAGESRVLLDVSGAGTIRRMWFTLSDRQPPMLRALRLEIYWDNAATPAVSAPFGDFFCAMLGRLKAFENELFSSPEGRSFNCYIPMPFRTGAKIVLTNDGDGDLEKLFYDVDYVLGPPDPDALYFHAYWHRERWTTLGENFAILPKVSGEGRFLGAHLGVMLHPDNMGWWGEGEVKMYVDGDTDYPTIAGTGTEDYIGTGWGQGVFSHRYQGSLVADGPNRQFTFYRYHVPDPVYFHQDMRVTIQQMGGSSKRNVLSLLKKGVPVKPVSVDYDEAGFVKLLEPEEIDLVKHDSPDDAWTNMLRQDDWSATALFYLDAPENGLPPLAPAAERLEAIPEKVPAEK